MEHILVSVPDSSKLEFLTKVLQELGLDYVSSLPNEELAESLTPEQQEKLDYAIKQYREGKVLTMNEFKERTASWFK
jgi:hypothetical protein